VASIVKTYLAINEESIYGQNATRLKFTYQDEFNELAIAFNLMAEAIEGRTQELNSIVSTMIDGLVITDNQGGIRSLNPAAERMFDVAAESLVGKHLNQLLPQMVDDIERHNLAARTGYRCEINGQRKDGSLFPVEVTLSEMLINNVLLFTCLLRDLSEQKNTQLALVNNEARLHAIIETVIEGIITIDSKGTVETMNPAAEKIFAYQANEVIGRNIKMLMPEPYHSQHDGYLQHFLATSQAKVIGIGREVVGRRKDGSVFPMELAVSEMSIDGVRMFTGLVRDITERKRTEDSLARLQRLHEQIFNCVGDGLHGIDMDGKIIFENPAAATMLGWNPEELIGQPSHSVMHHSRTNGTPYPQDQCPIYATRHDGITRHIQDEVFWRKDGTSFPIAYTCTPMRNDAGEIIGTVVAFRDISQIKAAENQLRDNAARIHAIVDTVVGWHYYHQ
jgi:PAS domain S-box-containing protein